MSTHAELMLTTDFPLIHPEKLMEALAEFLELKSRTFASLCSFCRHKFGKDFPAYNAINGLRQAMAYWGITGRWNPPEYVYVSDESGISPARLEFARAALNFLARYAPASTVLPKVSPQG